MAGVLVNQGEQVWLEAVVNKTAPQNLVLGLYKNNITPAETDTEATYTAADFTGYSSITLTGSSWGSAVAGAPSSIAFAQQTFTSSAAQATQQIYGYTLIQVTSGKLVASERFPAGPYPIANNGDNVKVTPTLTQD